MEGLPGFSQQTLTNPKMSSRIVIKIFLEGLPVISKKEIKILKVLPGFSQAKDFYCLYNVPISIK
jgi:hypothetical protein